MAESHFDRRRREWATYVTAWWAAVRGLPAVIVVTLGIAILAIAQDRQQNGEVRLRYLQAAKQAVETEDWSLVETSGRKLAQLRPADPVGQYYIALSVAARGQSARAVRLMNQIAPRDRLGFAPAHWWLVESLTAQDRKLGNNELLELRDHLRQYLETRQSHIQARVLLAQTEVAVGNPDEAVRQMGMAADLDPQLRLTAARLAYRLRRSTIARVQAEQASRYYRARIDEVPTDVEARLNGAETLTMLGRTDHAARMLAVGFELTQDSRLLAGFVRLCSNTFDILQESSGPTDTAARKQLSLLKQSLSLAPQSTPILKRLALLATQDTSMAREAGRLLDPYVTAGTAPAVVHLVLGTAAINRKRFEDAQRHFGRAHELDPAFPACMNNLAWSLAHGDQPDLQRALSLADEATIHDPQRPEFHETRGQILVMLGRYEEAVPELLQGLYTTGDVSATHARLADAYDALGKPKLASYHREQNDSESSSP